MRFQWPLEEFGETRWGKEAISFSPLPPSPPALLPSYEIPVGNGGMHGWAPDWLLGVRVRPQHPVPPV